MCFDFCFGSLVSIPIDIASSAGGLKICPTTTGIKHFKSIINKREKHGKIVLLANLS